MIALDTNILVYADRPDSVLHAPALRVITGLAEGDEAWALSWPCVYEYLRVVTHPKIFSPPTKLDDALANLDALLESPSLHLLGQGPSHWEHLRQTVLSGNAIGNLAHDAHIAALLREHGVREVWTTDRDFSRFPGLRVHNPLIRGEVQERRARYRVR